MNTPRSLTALVLSSLLVAGCGRNVEGGYYGSSAPYNGSSDPGYVPASPTTTDDCIDPAGFGGRGCWKCAPTANDELLNACTEAHPEAFDNATRIGGYEEATPKPPLVAQGPNPPAFGTETTSAPDPNAPPLPECPLETLANPVLVLGATGFPMSTIAKAMGKSATIVFHETGSCDGVAAMVLERKMTGPSVIYDLKGVETACTISTAQPPDITLSALFAQSCANQGGLAAPVALPSTIADLQGPISPIIFAVPATSSQRAISAEAAYRVYGLGSLSRVAPWEDEQYIFQRRPGSGNQLAVSLTLGIDVASFRGRDSNGSSHMLDALLASDQPEKTIGISSSEIVDPNRDVMHSLAYQHFGQRAAFYPDSDRGMYDRRNVRDGHYFMWIPLHLLVRTRGSEPVAAVSSVLDPDGTRAAARDAATKLLAYVMVNREKAPLPAVDLFGALKAEGTVPQCAMKVTRKLEGAPLEPFTPPVACGCAYEAASPGSAPASCVSCTDSFQCSGGQTCSFGYCE